MDRANMKPPQHPAHPDYDHKGFTHWDMDTSKLDTTPFGVQGVLALTDTDPDMGGFQCVPGFHKKPLLEEWVAAQPEGRSPRVPALDRLPQGMKVTPIPMKAGDLLIWDRRLAHGNGHNVSDKPRLAQYITMSPAREDNEEARQTRITMWRDRLPPKGDAFPGDPRGVEQQNPPAELTPLGRKLLGLDRWEDDAPADLS
jgi:ectoine hydroxylase-related dioxygenase (phytanoyl-CoA dioxygenase family)